ncbi:MAG: DegT/DnrJ/EryC1/StrS family aminotransferase [Limnochordia bacterium]|jgi:dTDP-4-amino-4,6-dideoxygalactose transaminase
MLAIAGGTPVRQKGFPKWPIHDESDAQAVADVIRSGFWGLGGQNVAEIEKRFAAFQDASYGVATSNGTVSLWLALTALGVGPGDEVIIPAYTFVATAAAVLQTGAVPVMADIDPDTYCLDPDAAEAAITPRTVCIIPVHVAGHPADLDRFVEIAQRHRLALLEDAAQAHGTQWKGRGVGAYGDLGTFSFQSSKNLSSGEGGMILSDNELLADMCLAYRNCGRWEGRSGARRVLGYNLRMTEMQAALLLSQMRRLEEQTRLRNENALYLAERLSEIEGIRPLKRDERTTRHAYHLFIFRVDAEVWGVSQDVFLEALAAEGIPCSRGYVPLYRDPTFIPYGQSCPAAWAGIGDSLAGIDYQQMFLPVTEKASSEAVWLSQSLLLGTKEDMDDIVAAVAKLWAGRQQLVGRRASRRMGYAGLS